MSHQLFDSVEPGPYKPCLILHGGAGSITRQGLPPELFQQYKSSLLNYLKATNKKLEHSNALDAACYAVSLMEEDPLFNCGKGSVFTQAGTIEMEASVMVCSINPDGPLEGSIKRGSAVSLIRETRHPILLARELLLDGADGLGGTASMHCHLSGREVEEWGWEKCGLEKKEKDWFWTKKRWDEHLRGLEGAGILGIGKEIELPSQGTVGAVCMDSWGNIAVATSTGGLTNKKVGRIGDTPTIGAGFWAESWDNAEDPKEEKSTLLNKRLKILKDSILPFENHIEAITQDCIPQWNTSRYRTLPQNGTTRQIIKTNLQDEKRTGYHGPSLAMTFADQRSLTPNRRAVAMSGTGNGDSFLRTNAVRTTAAMCRFKPDTSLASAIEAVAGPGGYLEKSAGKRWRKTGEGEGGIIGIELCSNSKVGKVIFDFNCGGLWRAWVDVKTGEERVMVFREEYRE